MNTLPHNVDPEELRALVEPGYTLPEPDEVGV